MPGMRKMLAERSGGFQCQIRRGRQCESIFCPARQVRDSLNDVGERKLVREGRKVVVEGFRAASRHLSVFSAVKQDHAAAQALALAHETPGPFSVGS